MLRPRLLGNVLCPVPGSDQPVSFQVVENDFFLRRGNLIYHAEFLHYLPKLDETVRLGSVGYPFLCNEPPEVLRRGLALGFFREDLGRPVWIILYKLCCLLYVAVERLHSLRIVVVVVLENEHVDERLRTEQVEALKNRK